MKKITLILFLIVISTVLQSQNIKRASFGAALVNINDSIAKANKLNNLKVVLSI